MLLGNRKKQEEEQNWSIVLTPLRNEIDKKKIARKITEVFSLSLSEASDLVANTPIILLDNLSKATAVKVRDYFRQDGAELILTNDIFYKRKCYRTVWPEAPNLSFLKDWPENGALTGVPAEKALEVNDALRELRLLNEAVPDVVPTESVDRQGTKESAGEESANSRLAEEAERWRRECALRVSEIEKLQAAAAILREQLSARESAGSPTLARHDSGRDQSLKDQQALIKSLQEKHEALREEYRQARAFFEEKVAASTRDSQDSRGKLKSLEDKARALFEKNQILEASLQKALTEQKTQRPQDLEEIRVREQRLNESVRELEEERKKNAVLEEQSRQMKQREGFLLSAIEEHKSQALALQSRLEDAERLKTSMSALESRLQTLTSSNSALEMSRQEEVENRKIHEAALHKSLTEARGQKEFLEIRLKDLQRELESRTRVSSELTEELRRIGEEKQRILQTFEERKRQEEETRSQGEALIRKYEGILAQHDSEKQAFVRAQQRIADLEADQRKLRAVLEEDSVKTSAAENRLRIAESGLTAAQAELAAVRRACLEKETEIAEKNRLLGIAALERDSLKRAYQETLSRAETAELKAEELLVLCREQEESVSRLEQVLTEKTKTAESKDREIEGLRRQIKDMTFQMEQREALLKRNQVMAQLAEREEKLKRLVEDQTRVETEIRQREETMRQILAQQEFLEKEIVEGKQAQRHLLEQVKKEKTAVSARGSKHETVSAGQAAASKKESAPHD